MKYMDALWHHADRQTDLLERISRQMSQLPTRTQLDDLLKMVRHLEQMTEQAGKPKENFFLCTESDFPDCICHMSVFRH